jgi:dihydrofolate reductase
LANRVYVAVSLDGYLAREDGAVDWLDRYGDGGETDYGYGEFVSAVDAIVMGRRTYESILRLSPGSWPYSKPVFVLSSVLPASQDDRRRLQILCLPPKQLVDHLAGSGHADLYIDGGNTIQRFLAEGLIDEMIISRIPVILGSGIPLFAAGSSEVELNHMETRVYPKGVVQNRYRLIRQRRGGSLNRARN